MLVFYYLAYIFGVKNILDTLTIQFACKVLFMALHILLIMIYDFKVLMHVCVSSLYFTKIYRYSDNWVLVDYITKCEENKCTPTFQICQNSEIFLHLKQGQRKGTIVYLHILLRNDD